MLSPLSDKRLSIASTGRYMIDSHKIKKDCISLLSFAGPELSARLITECILNSIILSGTLQYALFIWVLLSNLHVNMIEISHKTRQLRSKGISA
jgi:hypothetical protein